MGFFVQGFFNLFAIFQQVTMSCWSAWKRGTIHQLSLLFFFFSFSARLKCLTKLVKWVDQVTKLYAWKASTKDPLHINYPRKDLHSSVREIPSVFGWQKKRVVYFVPFLYIIWQTYLKAIVQFYITYKSYRILVVYWAPLLFFYFVVATLPFILQSLFYRYCTVCMHQLWR